MRAERVISNREWAATSSVAGAAFCAYLLTLAPGLLANDSGEFQTLAVTLGHTHPTGYPVYLLLAKLATLLPVGEPAYGVNLFSAIMAAVTVAGVGVLGSLLTVHPYLPLAGALALAISPTFWSQAIIAEVYSSGTACMVLVLICLAMWRRSDCIRWVFLAALLGGLSVGVHSTVALMAPAAVLFVASRRDRWMPRLGLAVGGAFCGLAVTVAGFTVLDALSPPSDYFHAVIFPSLSAWNLTPQDLDSFGERLWFCLTDQQSGYFTTFQSTSGFWSSAFGYLQNLPSEFPWLWLVAALLGLARLFRLDPRFGTLLVLTLATHLSVCFRSIMGDVQVLFLPSYVVIAVLGTIGLDGLVASITRNWRIVSPTKASGLRVEGTMLAVAAAVLIWPLFQTGAWTAEGRRAVWNPEEGEPEFSVEYSGELHRVLSGFIGELEDDAVVYTEWAWLYPLYYVAHVEQQRMELAFIQAYPRPDQRELAQSAQEHLRRAAQSQTAYLLLPDRLPRLEADLRTVPVTRGEISLYQVQFDASISKPGY